MKRKRIRSCKKKSDVYEPLAVYTRLHERVTFYVASVDIFMDCCDIAVKPFERNKRLIL